VTTAATASTAGCPRPLSTATQPRARYSQRLRSLDARLRRVARRRRLGRCCLRAIYYPRRPHAPHHVRTPQHTTPTIGCIRRRCRCRSLLPVPFCLRRAFSVASHFCSSLRLARTRRAFSIVHAAWDSCSPLPTPASSLPLARPRSQDTPPSPLDTAACAHSNTASTITRVRSVRPIAHPTSIKSPPPSSPSTTRMRSRGCASSHPRQARRNPAQHKDGAPRTQACGRSRRWQNPFSALQLCHSAPRRACGKSAHERTKTPWYLGIYIQNCNIWQLVSDIHIGSLGIIGTSHLHITLRASRILAPALSMRSGDLHRGKEQRAISVANGGFHTGI
jgi:hypothetical protein